MGEEDRHFVQRGARQLGGHRCADQGLDVI